MSLNLANYEELTKKAVAHFWSAGDGAQSKQLTKGTTDVGNRSRATAGDSMDGFVELIKQIVIANGLPEESVFINRGAHVTLPGYYRATKMWDLLIVYRGSGANQLVAAIELKSIASSFGNNLNNRCEEALGSATDFSAALREKAFGVSRPFTGYFMLMKDCEEVHNPVAVKEYHFEVFEDFKEASYARRCELFCQRLVTEKLYDAATALLSSDTEGKKGEYSELSEASSWRNWIASLAGHVASVAATLGPTHRQISPLQQTLPILDEL